jgi:hypothetical protein
MTAQSTSAHTAEYQKFLKAILAHFSTIALAGSAVVYASGFLIVFIFHDSYRLRAVDTDLFKVRFFHVGIMFVALLGNIILPALASGVYARYRKGPPTWVINPVGIAVFSIMIFNFIVVVFFAPPGAFRDWNVQAGLLTTVALPLLLVALSKRMKDKRSRVGIRLVLTGVVGLALLGCTGLILKNYYADLVPMALPAASWFAFFALFMALVVWLLATADKDREPHEKRIRIIFSLAILGLLYFLAINSFALGLYNFIPAAKGGGDFRTGRVIVRFREDNYLPLPSTWITGKDQDVISTKSLVFIEGTSAAIYVADPDQNMGPRNWRRSVRGRPSVIELKRDTQMTVEYCPD